MTSYIMTPARLTAKEAIEGLKLHYLRRENVTLHEENQKLRNDNAGKQYNTNGRDIAMLTEGLKDVLRNVKEIGLRFDQIEAKSADIDNGLKALHQGHNTLKDDLMKISTAFDGERQSKDGVQQIREQPAQFQTSVEELQHVISDEIQRSLHGKADVAIVKQLGSKLESCLQELDMRIEVLNASLADQEDEDVVSRSVAENCFDTNWGNPVETQETLHRVPCPQSAGLEDQLEEVVDQTSHMSGPLEQRTADSRRGCDMSASNNLQARSAETISYSDALHWLLTLRQHDNETLPRYLERFWMHPVELKDPEIISVGLRRFVNGVIDDEQKLFLGEWMRTSAWTLENVQDGILVMTKYQTRSAHKELVEAVGILAQCEDGINHDLQHTRTGDENASATHVLSEQYGKRTLSVDAVQNRRMQPRQAIKTGRKLTSKGSRYKKGIKFWSKTGVKEQKVVDGKPLPFKETASVESTNFALSAGVQVAPTMPKRSRKNKLQPELKGISDSQPIDKSVQRAIMLRKRKADINLKDVIDDRSIDHCSRSSTDSPLTKEHSERKRIPTLVKNRTRLMAGSETSDVVKLPPMPDRPDGDGRREDTDILEESRKRRRQSPPEIPILMLSTDDFRD